MVTENKLIYFNSVKRTVLKAWSQSKGHFKILAKFFCLDFIYSKSKSVSPKLKSYLVIYVLFIKFSRNFDMVRF